VINIVKIIQDTHYVVCGEYPSSPLDQTAPPVFVLGINDLDDIALFEGQFTGLGGFECMHCANASNCGRPS